MSDFIPKSTGIKIGGLSRQAQKLQAAREKAAAATLKTGGKPASNTPAPSFKAKTSFAGKKTSFQRKAV